MKKKYLLVTIVIQLGCASLFAQDKELEIRLWNDLLHNIKYPVEKGVKKETMIVLVQFENRNGKDTGFVINNCAKDFRNAVEGGIVKFLAKNIDKKLFYEPSIQPVLFLPIDAKDHVGYEKALIDFDAVRDLFTNLANKKILVLRSIQIFHKSPEAPIN